MLTKEKAEQKARGVLSRYCKQDDEIEVNCYGSCAVTRRTLNVETSMPIDCERLKSRRFTEQGILFPAL